PLKGPFQAPYGGSIDAFVAKLNTNAVQAESLVYSSYLGGAGTDFGYGIAINALGYAYVSGSTTSAAGFGRGGYQPALAGGQDALEPTGLLQLPGRQWLGCRTGHRPGLPGQRLRDGLDGVRQFPHRRWRPGEFRRRRQRRLSDQARKRRARPPHPEHHARPR